jgi:hypothetical protein
MGNTSEASGKIDELVSLGHDRYVSPLLTAQVLAGLERFDEAMACIRKAQAIGATDLIWLHLKPQFEPLHDHPSFAAACTRLGVNSVRR